MAKFSDHLNSNRHKLSVKNKQCFKEMSNRNANVWQMAFNASLQSGETKRQNNRFILKCFFKITFLMIRKNWAHSHNFRDIVELEKHGLKRHLEHKVPLLKWIGCNNHKLALTF